MITKAPTLKFEDQVATNITANIINLYFTYRRHDDIANEYLINNNGSIWTRGTKTIILLQCTFIILDAFLNDYTDFDNGHNRKAFEKVLPFTKYLTLKFKCREIESKKVKLSFLENIFFLQCVDCALKLLLGDKADILVPQVEKRGMDEEIRGMYIAEGGMFVQGMFASFKKSGARVMNLEELYDWDALFR